GKFNRSGVVMGGYDPVAHGALQRDSHPFAGDPARSYGQHGPEPVVLDRLHRFRQHDGADPIGIDRTAEDSRADQLHTTAFLYRSTRASFQLRLPRSSSET